MHDSNFKCFCLLRYVAADVALNILLQLFDEYGNHVQENKKVEFRVNGFCWLDRSLSSKKVDGSGCIDLSGLLRVDQDFGRNGIIHEMLIHLYYSF